MRRLPHSIETCAHEGHLRLSDYRVVRVRVLREEERDMEYLMPSLWILVVAMLIAAALVATLVFIGVSIFFLIHKFRA